MKEKEKAEKQELIQQQLQTSFSASQIPTSRSSMSSVQLCTNESISIQATPNTYSISTSQPTHNAKRRITSESQQCLSRKRIPN